MRARPSAAVVLGVMLGVGLALAAPSGGCGPVVAPSEGPDAGDEAETGPPLDLCARPDAPAACDAGQAGGPDASTATCRGGEADGRCELTLEGCECLDCAALARCAGQCVDDGVCRRGGSAGSGGAGSGGAGSGGAAGSAGSSTGLDEDCSCADCGGKVAGCVPDPIGCKANGVCSILEDDCACGDCRDERDCEACVDNGFCARYTEGCGCADCAALPECQADAAP